MSNTWFTSDTHFGHKRISEYCGRPFKSTEEMDEALIKNWNELVQKDDVVYHLGDFSFSNLKKIENIKRRLNGQVNLIRGNHDQEIPNDTKLFGWVKDYYELKIDGIDIILSHYPFLEWNKSHKGAIQLSGHTHAASWLVRPNKKGIHVGVDAWDMKPVSWEQIKELANKIEIK